jgi:hypothetical protein
MTCQRWLILFLLVPLGAVPEASVAAAEENGPRVEFILVAPNTGGSSGGHAGLRIGGSVYHFMAGSFDSLLLLYRVTWEDFHGRYCELENRQLDITRLALSADAAGKILSQLKNLLAPLVIGSVRGASDVAMH